MAAYEKKGRDLHGDRYIVQSYVPSLGYEGAIFLEVKCKETGESTLHEYTPAQARKLAVRLLAASIAARNES